MNVESLQPTPQTAAYAFGDCWPRQVAQPMTVAEVAEVLAAASRAQAAVVPWGAGTRQFLMNPPPRYDLALDLRRLDRVIEYHPADLVVMVEAGITLGALQAVLAEHGQWLPWDPPTSDTAPIGGLLATAAWGPLRLGYGGPRDWLLGMRVVLGDGRIVQSGGRVVKNVAGYDNHKLHLGAFGTLGVIAAVTFKVAPLPERIASVRAVFATPAAALHAATAIRQPPTQPVALAITVAETVTLAVRFAGVAAAVERQLGLATAACALAEAVTLSTDDRELWAVPSAPDDALVLRIGVPERMLAAAIDAVTALAPSHLAIFPGLGLMVGRWSMAAATHLPALRQTLAEMDGYAVVERGPAGIDRWGPPPPTIDLMRALRQRWDPAGILNPGRWLVE
ncbi:FAD-binding oxidoreductase [uncultured Chloroflexus sp.]|uniref:FAD-binding oxidoreductase n=1 Tax=uncultured Chloroflexus sp. TaxID=214040 RepID=UPI002606D649|nr:FAD-binding oxidoreductase [uncultured Chloroflexus sp.]